MLIILICYCATLCACLYVLFYVTAFLRFWWQWLYFAVQRYYFFLNGARGWLILSENTMYRFQVRKNSERVIV